ncbi:M15 family metallopeptidase [Sphingomonas sp. CARO-RG-8B-R24-01]|uniref:M15 family metallopeptidase n=1 Tax=Sphingomonas sp. CARO-RG-8B-R24-01 TaxID=2914831 RepID=UPI001F58074E
MLIALLAGSAALAQPARPGAPTSLVASDDGRMLGHLPYGDARAQDLVIAPSGFSVGATCRVHRDMLPDLDQMLAAAATAPGVGNSLRGISCHRDVARQHAVFCHERHRATCIDAVDRARSVAPPGYSEHATGYAIDFGLRPSRACPDVSYCFASTAPGQWLLAHAPDYGFELSFPAGNRQGLTWEPWHWRWVGTRETVPGALAARALFARARTLYPALPIARDVLAANAAAAPVPGNRIAPTLLPLPDIGGLKIRRR